MDKNTRLARARQKRGFVGEGVVIVLTETVLYGADLIPPGLLGFGMAITGGLIAFFVGRWLETQYHFRSTIPLEEVATLEVEVATLRAKVAARERNRALANDLQVEWEYGLNQLLNADVPTPKEYARYKFNAKDKEWQERVQAI